VTTLLLTIGKGLFSGTTYRANGTWSSYYAGSQLPEVGLSLMKIPAAEFLRSMFSVVEVTSENKSRVNHSYIKLVITCW
jgi:hypothetical protein